MIFDASKANDINALYRTEITELDLRNAKLRRRIVAIRGLPLEKIIMPRHEPNKHIPHLITCKTLTEVHLPEKTTDKDLLKELPKSIKVIFY